MGRDQNTTIGQITKDFGVHEGTITNWVCEAEIDAVNKPGQSIDESAKLREMAAPSRF